MSRGKIIIVVAPSGTGKSTMIKKLKEDFRQIHWSVSFTTRPVRKGEVDGKHYFFISKEEFEKKIKLGDFVEWANVHNNFYGTSKGFVDSKIDHGHSILFELDVQGADAMKRCYGNEAHVLFVTPPSERELESRLRNRGTDSEEVILLRLNNAKLEMKRKDDYDFCVVNDNLEKAYCEINQIVKNIIKE